MDLFKRCAAQLVIETFGYCHEHEYDTGNINNIIPSQ